MATFIDHSYSHITSSRHILHNVLLSLGVAGLLLAVDQFYTGRYVSLAAGYLPVAETLTFYPESDRPLVLVPATNSVRGVCYIRGTDMWDVANHRVCTNAEPVCRTINNVVVGCESKRIIR